MQRILSSKFKVGQLHFFSTTLHKHNANDKLASWFSFDRFDDEGK